MESPPPAPPRPATAAFPAPGSGLGTLFGVQRSDPGGKAGEGPGAGGRVLKPRPRPQVRPAGGGGNFRSALREARGGSFEEGAAAPPPPVPGEGEADPPWSLSSPLTNSLRILRPREPEGRTRLGKGRHVGGRTPSRWWGRGQFAARFGVQDRRRRAGRAVHAQPGSRAEWRARATSFQRRGLGRRRGVAESAARGPRSSPPSPGGRRKRGWTPRNARLSLNWAEARVLLRVLRVGETILSGARVLRGQVRKGVTLPFPVPDPIVSVACGPGRLRNTCWLH